MILLAGLGCQEEGADRVHYAAGLRAETAAEAWASCREVRDEDLRGDCTSAVIERFRDWDRCGEVDAGRWQDECFFLAAEVQARTGDVDGALSACLRSGYAEQCNDHVLGIWAMSQLESDVPAVAAGLEKFRAVIVAPRALAQVWRSWFRNRIARSLPVDPAACPDKDCRAAAEMEVSAAIRELQRRTGDAAFCAGPPPYPTWVVTAQVRAWVDRQAVRGCTEKTLVGPDGQPVPAPLSPGGAARTEGPPTIPVPGRPPAEK